MGTFQEDINWVRTLDFLAEVSEVTAQSQSCCLASGFLRIDWRTTWYRAFLNWEYRRLVALNAHWYTISSGGFWEENWPRSSSSCLRKQTTWKSCALLFLHGWLRPSESPRVSTPDSYCGKSIPKSEADIRRKSKCYRKNRENPSMRLEKLSKWLERWTLRVMLSISCHWEWSIRSTTSSTKPYFWPTSMLSWENPNHQVLLLNNWTT